MVGQFLSSHTSRKSFRLVKSKKVGSSQNCNGGKPNMNIYIWEET